jgi:hypothetical protein
MSETTDTTQHDIERAETAGAEPAGISEAIAITGRSANALYRLIGRELRAVQVRGRWRFNRDDLKRLAASDARNAARIQDEMDQIARNFEGRGDSR